MGGFGSGPFGREPFGEWKWSREVLYDYAPALHKAEDAKLGGPFEAFTNGLRPSFDALRGKVRDWADLRDPLAVRTRYNETAMLRLGGRVPLRGPVVQQGLNGSVSAFQEFSAPTARFRIEDIGRELEVTDTSVLSNNRPVVVAVVINPTTVKTSPPLAATTGVKWQLRERVASVAENCAVEVQFGKVSSIRPGSILSDGYAEFTVVSRSQLPDRTDREGTDGSFTTSVTFPTWQGSPASVFSSPTGAFTLQDIGKRVAVSNASVAANNGTFEVVALIDADNVLVAGATVADPTPVQWALLPLPQLTVRGAAPTLRGVIEQRGLDASVAGLNFSASSGQFISSDVGKVILVRGGATAIESTATVTACVSPTQLTVDAPLPVDATAWELRSVPGNDPLDVTVQAPSLVALLAQDFGIEIDNQDNEARQRSWVRNITQWIGYKGTPKGYEVLGALSGYRVTATTLYSVTKEIVTTYNMPVAHVFEIVVEGVNRVRTGSDGSLTVPGGNLTFSAPTARFRKADEGSYVRVTGSASPVAGGNDDLFLITEYVNATTVRVSLELPVEAPDTNNGVLNWSLVRLYTDLPPRYPSLFEVNPGTWDTMIQATQPGKRFSDRYDWASDFSASMTGSITAVGPTSPETQITFLPAYTPSLTAVVSPGNWKIVDSAGVEYWLDTVPVTWIDNGTTYYRFNVVAATPPALGSATVSYETPVTLSCAYGTSRRVLAIIVEESLEEDALQLERALERVLARLVSVTPVHVDLLPRARVYIPSATLNLQAEIETHEYANALIAALSVSTDMPVPIDQEVWPVDTLLYATVEVP